MTDDHGAFVKSVSRDAFVASSASILNSDLNSKHVVYVCPNNCRVVKLSAVIFVSSSKASVNVQRALTNAGDPIGTPSATTPCNSSPAV
eukprot:6097958-Ditylum_brightwellii.AAC.1